MIRERDEIYQLLEMTYMQRLGIRAKLFLAISAFAVLLSAAAWWYVNRQARAQAPERTR